MIVGHARASTADHAPDDRVPAQRLHDVSTEPVQQITDLFGAPPSTVRDHLDRVPTGAPA